MAKTPDFRTCQYCGHDRLSFKWQTFGNGTTHIRTDCARCRRCLGYAPQTAEFILKAGFKPLPVLEIHLVRGLPPVQMPTPPRPAGPPPAPMPIMTDRNSLRGPVPMPNPRHDCGTPMTLIEDTLVCPHCGPQ